MIDIEKGRYWGSPWSLVSGCTPCSPGCERCWSAAMEHRFKQTYPSEDFTKRPAFGPIYFTGKIQTHPERLSVPLKRRKPTVYAVWNDLFHEEAVPDLFKHEAYSMMALCSHHVFLVLTKRAENIARYFSRPRVELGTRWFEARKYRKDRTTLKPIDCGTWPRTGIPNVYHGLTVCNQEEADAKIPVFLRVPGKKFLSIEPMLGPINLTYLNARWPVGPLDSLNRGACNRQTAPLSWNKIDSVILGGETGAGARPMWPEWVRSIRDQCDASGTPFFFKSWGKYKGPDDWKIPAGREIDGRTHDDLPWGPS